MGDSVSLLGRDCPKRLVFELAETDRTYGNVLFVHCTLLLLVALVPAAFNVVFYYHAGIHDSTFWVHSC